MIKLDEGQCCELVGYYYTRDHLGSVREMCNSSGTFVSRLSYDSYGRTTIVSGTILSTKQYAGLIYHSVSGCNFATYRIYNPQTSTWLSRDLLAETGGLNLYEYAGNNPINAIDPDGLAYYALSKEEGAAQLATLGPLMQKKCDTCVCPSKVADCKQAKKGDRHLFQDMK